MALTNLAFGNTCKNLPEPTGLFQVGVTFYDLVDPSRKELEYPEGRLIPIQIYFPMQKGSHTPHPKIFEERTPPKWKPLDILVYSQKADLSLLNQDEKHPLILLNHGDTVAMTDYAFLAEDLASHGYIVISIQHQLKTDPDEPTFWKERSISRYGKIIDNLLYLFEWLQDNQALLFNNQINLKRIGLMGHSMGGNALLLLASRASNTIKGKQSYALLPHQDARDVQEVLVVLDTGGFPYPHHRQYPLFMLFAEGKELYHKNSGAYDEMIQLGHKVAYYKGAKHISFMDHGYIDPPHPFDPTEHYFDGSVAQKVAFFDLVRQDIREFLIEHHIESRKE